MTLSVCMIVKNEAQVLARALHNAAVYADEIIVVDTGSTDDTKKIARSFTDKVYDFEWLDDFAAARNFSFAAATCDYIMWLDADDVVPARSARAIARLKNNLDADVVMLPYVAESENGKPKFSYFRERIVKNHSGFIWRGRVHEAITPHGIVITAKAAIYHAKPQGRRGTRNLDIYEKMRAQGERFGPRETYYYARELYYAGRYADAQTEFKKFIADPNGFYVNKADACVLLSRCLNKSGDKIAALSALYDSFIYGLPTGEALCEIALIYYSMGKFSLAAYWFERAASSKPDYDSGAFVDRDYYGFLPYVWLSVCYDKLGDTDRAFAYHRKAERLKPDHPSVAANREYFNGLGYKVT